MMANRRMLHRNIAVCEQLADCSILARLLFTWALPHTSDWGVLIAAPRRLKAQVFPISSETPDEIGSAAQELVSAGLWATFEQDGTEYVYYPSFDKYQDIHNRSSNPRDGLPIPPCYGESPRLPATSRDLPPKGREGKLKEVKNSLSGSARRKQRHTELSAQREALLGSVNGYDLTLVQAYLESAALKNTTGKQTLGGEVSKLAEILELRAELIRDDPEHGAERWRHGMSEAGGRTDRKTGVVGITVANYVRSCALSWSPDGGRPQRPAEEQLSPEERAIAEMIARGPNL